MLHSKELHESLPAINVAGTVGKCLLDFSKQEFHFILYSDDEESSYTKENLFIRNKAAEDVSLRIDCEEFSENCPFLFVKMKGSSITREGNSIYTTLEYNEYAMFKLAFVPELAGYYKSEAAVFITDYSCKEPFCYISYDGTWTPPTIQLETSEIFFPPVPLGIQLSTIVELKLLHYIGVPYIIAKIAPVLDDNGWNMAETITVDFGDKGNEERESCKERCTTDMPGYQFQNSLCGWLSPYRLSMKDLRK
ncbi:uncharacterized protein LOC126267919 [Schistocerca gregaria]|uniref:uncharacterized protein LOC126267919 n=1 Tax=Schistocerca gregaria TaxID=7010 RepID=UPI00211DC2F7|nr:uncharacterized protein LOC126267919 [Schistocerca gregaria]